MIFPLRYEIRLRGLGMMERGVEGGRGGWWVGDGPLEDFSQLRMILYKLLYPRECVL